MVIKNVTVIGSGTMGNGIAHVFAQYGYNVTLNDISQEFLDRGMKTIATITFSREILLVTVICIDLW